MKRKGNIYIIAAASGTGKTSLVNLLVESLDNITVSISYTTRPPRLTEQDGDNYFFVSEKQFLHMIKANEFLEHAKVFDHYYGTNCKWVVSQLEHGIDVILEIDWQGARQIKASYPECISIFILPPSTTELRRRLQERAQDDKAVIAKRLAESHQEIVHCKEFDYIVINDKFDVALADLRSIIRSQHLLRANQLVAYQELLEELSKVE